ncbi:MAG: VOC family protein [Pseudomonadota bacterium]
MSLPPFQPLGLDHVVVLVDDLERARRFYCEVLGCTSGFEYPGIAMTHVWFGSILIGLWDMSDARAAYARPEVTGGRNVDHLGLAVGPFDLDAMRAHLNVHGVPIEKELVQGGARGVGQSVYIRDPFGTRIELKGPGVYPDGRAVD